MRILFFDCFSGIAGDMCVGALRDLGVAEDVFTAALDAVGLPEGLHAHFHRGARRGIAGWKFHVHESHHGHPHEHAREHTHGHAHDHGHDHEQGHGHTHGRSYAQIRDLLSASGLAPRVKERALAVFRRIAVAEGRIHGVPPDDVGFHEVGAVDSIADIVAACAGIEALSPDFVCASPLVEGSGFIECAHGRFPLPAPATLALLEGIPLRQVEEQCEFVTPTGAAILAEYCTAFGPMPAMRVSVIGYGLGTRDSGPRPNVLRAVLGEAADDVPAGGDGYESDEVALLEANLDDMTPELLACACEAVRKAGALDVWVTPATMKKGRSAQILHALVEPSDSGRIAGVVLAGTSSFGVRISGARRLKLARDFVEVETRFGPVRAKRGMIGGRVVKVVPELDACAALAESAGVPVAEVYLAAQAAVR